MKFPSSSWRRIRPPFSTIYTQEQDSIGFSQSSDIFRFSFFLPSRLTAQERRTRTTIRRRKNSSSSTPSGPPRRVSRSAPGSFAFIGVSLLHLERPNFSLFFSSSLLSALMRDTGKTSLVQCFSSLQCRSPDFAHRHATRARMNELGYVLLIFPRRPEASSRLQS